MVLILNQRYNKSSFETLRIKIYKCKMTDSHIKPGFRKPDHYRYIKASET